MNIKELIEYLQTLPETTNVIIQDKMPEEIDDICGYIPAEIGLNITYTEQTNTLGLGTE